MGRAADEAGDELLETGRKADRAKKPLKDVGDESDKTRKKIGGLSKIAKQLFAGFTVALVLNELRKVSAEFGDFEQRLRGVGKTSDISGAELEALGRRLEELSRPGKGGLAVSVDLLLENAEAAGQLGVTGAANIAIYAETISKLGVASNLAGAEGAQALARLQNITGENASTVGTLASVIVRLGNEFATTEAQIAFHAQQVARATASYEVSSGEAAALGTAMSAFGVRAELAGSSVGRAMRVISAAILEGGAKMEALSRISGASAEEIAAAWERRPVEALQLLLQGIERFGERAPQALAEVGLKGQELLQVLPVLAKENETLARALKATAEETENATALDKEFAAAMATQEGRLRLLSNEWETFRRRIGSGIAPAVAGLAAAIGSVLSSVTDWLDQGADLNRLLDELAPKADTAAEAFRNLALEVERSAEAQKLLQLIATYNRLLDEQAKVASSLRGLTAEESSGVIGIKLEATLKRIGVALTELPTRIDKARAALANVGKESDEAASGLGEVAVSLARSSEAADGLRDRLILLDAQLRGDHAGAVEEHRQALAEWTGTAKEAGLTAEEVALGVSLMEEAFERNATEAANRHAEALDRIGYKRLSEEIQEYIRWLQAVGATWAEIETAAEQASRIALGAAADAAASGMDPEAARLLLIERLGLTDILLTKEQRLAAVDAEIQAILKTLPGLTREQAKAVEEAVKHSAGLLTTTEKWQGALGQVSGVLRGINSDLADMLDSVLSIVDGFEQFDSSSFGSRAQGGLAIGGAVGSAAAGTDFGGGQWAQTLSAVGGAIGGAIGGAQAGAVAGPVGAVIGAALGLIIGGFLDTSGKIAQSYGGLISEGGRLVVNVLEAANQTLLRETDQALRAVAGALNAIADRFGAEAVWSEVALQIRQEGDDVFKVWTNGILSIFDNIAEATDFAIVQGVKNATFVGLSPVAQAAIDRFTGTTAAELEQALAAAFEVEQLGIPESMRAFENEIDRYMDLLRALPEGAAQILGDFGAGGAFQDQYNRLFGIQEDAGKLREAEILALKASVEVRMAELLALRAELEARQVSGRARVSEADLILRTAEAGAVGIDIFGRAMAGAGGVAVAVAQDMGAALAAIDSALGALGALDFSAGAIEEAIARARRAARGASGAAAPKPPDPTESLREQLERLRLGSDEAALALLDFERRRADLIAQMEQSTLTEEERAEFLALLYQEFADERVRIAAEEAQRIKEEAEAARIAAEEARRSVLQPFIDAVQDDSISARIAEINQLVADALASLAVGNKSLSDFETIMAGAAAMMAALANETRRALDGAAGSVIGLINQALPHIQDPEERARLQQRLVEWEQLQFQLAVATARINIERYRNELILLEQLDPIRAAWIENLLGDLDIISGNMENIFEGLGDIITGAGETFAGTVGTAFSGAIQGLRVLFPDLLPVMSPPRTSGQVEGAEGVLLAQLLAQLDQLSNVALDLDPFEALLAAFSDPELVGFLEAFGLSLEDLTQQINDLREAERQREFDLSFGALQDSLMPGGSQSGASNRQQLMALQQQIDEALAAGDFQLAAQLAQSGLDIAAQTNPRIWEQWRDLILATQINGGFGGGTTGTGLPPGGPGDQIPGGGIGSGFGGGAEINVRMLNVFEADAERRREADQIRERNRGMQTQDLGDRLDRVEGAIKMQTPFLAQIAADSRPRFGAKA